MKKLLLLTLALTQATASYGMIEQDEQNYDQQYEQDYDQACNDFYETQEAVQAQAATKIQAIVKDYQARKSAAAAAAAQAQVNQNIADLIANTKKKEQKKQKIAFLKKWGYRSAAALTLLAAAGVTGMTVWNMYKTQEPQNDDPIYPTNMAPAITSTAGLVSKELYKNLNLSVAKHLTPAITTTVGLTAKELIGNLRNIAPRGMKASVLIPGKQLTTLPKTPTQDDNKISGEQLTTLPESLAQDGNETCSPPKMCSQQDAPTKEDASIRGQLDRKLKDFAKQGGIFTAGWKWVTGQLNY